jgi:hypothetical protein
MPRPVRRVAIAAVLLLSSATSVPAQELVPVVSARQIWTGSTSSVLVEDIALRVAPILWFSGDEPLFRDNLDGPIRLPCDTPAKGKVVYYRARTSAFRHSRRRAVDATPPGSVLTLERPNLRIDYFFFYPRDYGGGCHSNDLESVTMELRLEVDGEGEGARYRVALRTISGAAHGSHFFSNDLVLTKLGTNDVSLPIVLLVEEGKHAVAPDRNADGHYTPGYDINRSLNDAWGVRDIFGASQLGPSAYQGWMTKPRHGDNRFRAHTDRASALWATSYRSAWWPKLPDSTYELRALPSACLTYQDPPPEPEDFNGCKKRSVSYFLKAKGLRPEKSGFIRSAASLYWQALQSLRAIYETTPEDSPARARLGFSSSIPVYEVPLIGGIISLRQTALFEDWRRKNHPDRSSDTSLEYQAFYSPSISRRFDWYAGGGLGLDFVTSPITSAEVVYGRMIGEAGIQFRWEPNLLVGIGAKLDNRRPIRLVIEVGRSSIPGFGR